MPNYTLYYFNGRGRAEIIRMMFAAAGVKYTDKRFEFGEWDKYRKDMPGMCVPVLEIDGKHKMPETMAIARYLAREFGFYGRSSMDMMKCDYICDCFYEIMHDYMRYFHWKNGRFRFSGPMMGGGGGGHMMGSSGGQMMSGGGGQTMSSGGGQMISSGGQTMSAGGGQMMSGGGGQMMSGGGGQMMSAGGGQTMSAGGGKMMSGGGGQMMAGGGKMMSGGGQMMPGGMHSDMAGYDHHMHWRYMNTCHRVLPFLERTLCMHNNGNHYFMGEQMMWCDMMCYCCLENPYMENQSMFGKYPKLMALRTRVASHQKISGYLKSRSKTMW